MANNKKPSVGRLRGAWRHLRASSQKWMKARHGEFFKKPARLLRIVELKEREHLFRKGRMAFILQASGKPQRLELSLDKRVDGEFSVFRLVAPIAIDGKVFTLRYNPFYRAISVFEVVNGEEVLRKNEHIVCEPKDMGHMILTSLERRNIVVPLIKVAAEHAVASAGFARAEKVFLRTLKKRLESAGYVVKSRRKIPQEHMEVIKKHADNQEAIAAGKNYRKAGIMDYYYTMEYAGKSKELNNLDTHYRFIAMDPKTGSMRSFYYPILKK